MSTIIAAERLHYVHRTALGLVEYTRYVFTYYAERYQLTSSQEKHHAHDGRIAGHRIAIQQRAYKHIYQIHYSTQGREYTHHRGETQRGCGEACYAFDGKIEQRGN